MVAFQTSGNGDGIYCVSLPLYSESTEGVGVMDPQQRRPLQRMHRAASPAIQRLYMSLCASELRILRNTQQVACKSRYIRAASWTGPWTGRSSTMTMGRAWRMGLVDTALFTSPTLLLVGSFWGPGPGPVVVTVHRVIQNAHYVFVIVFEADLRSSPGSGTGATS